MLIMMGPVGSGKSAQAQILIEKYHYKWLSAGDLLRGNPDPKIQAILASGQLVDDETIKMIIEQAIKSIPKSQDIILDGFPRRVSQATWLEGVLSEVSRDISAVIHIYVPPEETLNRMKLRGRSDDSIKSIEQRNAVYKQEVMPVIDYYKDQGNLFEVDGVGSVDEVADRIKNIIESI